MGKVPDLMLSSYLTSLSCLRKGFLLWLQPMCARSVDRDLCRCGWCSKVDVAAVEGGRRWTMLNVDVQLGWKGKING